MKKIILFSIAILFLFSASSFAQVGLMLKGQGTYGILLKPDIQEIGFPEEKLTKGGFGFSGQVLYRAGKILSLGVEVGYLRFWKWEFTGEMWRVVDGTPELVDVKFESSYSAVPILGFIQIEAPPAFSFSLFTNRPGDLSVNCNCESDRFRRGGER